LLDRPHVEGAHSREHPLSCRGGQTCFAGRSRSSENSRIRAR
jgi:hypothetical protein